MHRLSRVAAALALSLAIVAGVPSLVVASFPWIAECNGGANSNYLCIYSARDLQGQLGHMAGGNSSYVNETYPSSTVLVDNSVSSMKNLYGTKDVIWFWDPSSGGNAYCVNPNTAVLWPGLFNNDMFSSHAVAADNNAC